MSLSSSTQVSVSEAQFTLFCVKRRFRRPHSLPSHTAHVRSVHTFKPLAFYLFSHVHLLCVSTSFGAGFCAVVIEEWSCGIEPIAVNPEVVIHLIASNKTNLTGKIWTRTKEEKCIWHVPWLFSLLHVLYTNMTFMTHTAGSHQGAIKKASASLLGSSHVGHL